MILIALVLSFIAIWLENRALYIQGLVGGCLCAILNFRMLARTIKKSIYMIKEKARVYAFMSYIIRYVLMGLIFVSTALYSHEMFFGTVAGVTSFQLAIYSKAFSK